MKKLAYFLILFGINQIQAQNPLQSLKEANRDLYQLADSLRNLENLLGRGGIDTLQFVELSGELLTQLSSMAYSNYDNYARLDYFNTEETVATPPNPPMGAMVDAVYQGQEDTIPETMPEMPEYKAPMNPMSLITGSGRRTGFRLRYGMYWNGLSQAAKKDAINYPDFNVGKSFNWFGELDILLQTKLGKNRGPFSIYYGLGFDRRHYTQTDDVQILNTVADKANFRNDTTQNYEESTLHLGYLRFPVGLQYKKNKLVLNLGGYIGILTNHEQSVEFKTAQNEEALLYLDKNYDFSKTNYGLSASIGYRRLHLGINYDLSTLFSKSKDYEYNAWRVGILLF